MGTLLLASAVTLVVVFAITYAIGVRIGRHNVVDATWGLAFAAVAVVCAVVGDGDAGRRWLLAALVVVWGLRLAIHLAIRSRGAGEDPRYVDLLAKAKGSPTWAVISRVYLLQAVLVFLISLPVQFNAASHRAADAWVIPGIALWVVGLAFEAGGDAQLRRFKADPANRGKIMTIGLWRYTRHPNYFGDACVWWGLYLVAASGSVAAALTFAAPVIMTILLVRVSGGALLDRRMANRPGFAEYAARTSAFVPRPPKR
jgi:steroid 5-alpha reductase family enzyme